MALQVLDVPEKLFPAQSEQQAFPNFNLPFLEL